MSSHSNIPADTKLVKRQEKEEKRDHRVEHTFRRILHFPDP